MKGNMKEQKKSKAKNLTDAICRSLSRLDKRYMKQGDFPGLEFWVQPGGSKSWYYQFRIKGTKDQLRKKIGTYPTIGVTEAFNRAKQLAKDIYDGNDPRSVEKIEILKEQLGSAIRRYTGNNYSIIPCRITD